jgi:AcrR family transcriptional regulator
MILYSCCIQVARLNDKMSSRRARPTVAGKTRPQLSEKAPVSGPGTERPPSPWRASRERQHDREVKREAVIRAAAHAFNHKGYHNTSLDDIAAALEVTKPTVYYYVTNKEQLLFECFVAGVEQIRAGFREAKSLEAPARERLNVVLRNYAKAMASEFGWCMVRVEDQDLSPAMSSHVKTLKSEIDQGIRRLIREGVQDGSIHPCDPKMTAFALAGSLNWIAHWYRENQSMTPAQIADAFITVFDNGLQPRAPIVNDERTADRLAGNGAAASVARRRAART